MQEMLGLRIGRVRNVVEGLQECFTYLSSSLLGQGAKTILLENTEALNSIAAAPRTSPSTAAYQEGEQAQSDEGQGACPAR